LFRLSRNRTTTLTPDEFSIADACDFGGFQKTFTLTAMESGFAVGEAFVIDGTDNDDAAGF